MYRLQIIYFDRDYSKEGKPYIARFFIGKDVYDFKYACELAKEMMNNNEDIYVNVIEVQQ